MLSNGVSKIIIGFIVLIALLLWCLQATAVLDGLRNRNSSAWFQYGPAIIDSCDKIVLRLGHAAEPTIITAGDNRFLPLQKWLDDNINDELDSPPMFPSYYKRQHDYTISLYCGQGANNLLLEIPLNEVTLGKTGKALELEIDLLKRLVSSTSQKKAHR